MGNSLKLGDLPPLSLLRRASSSVLNFGEVTQLKAIKKSYWIDTQAYSEKAEVSKAEFWKATNELKTRKWSDHLSFPCCWHGWKVKSFCAAVLLFSS